jgi:hypothetical protein
LACTYSNPSTFYIEGDRNLTTKNLHARLTLIRNAKLQSEIVDKIIKRFPDMPDQWIAAAQYILFSTISSYLKVADQYGLEREDMTLTEAKNRIRHSVLSHTARIMAEIDAYPDIANLENWYQSHDQLLKLFDESKK